MADENEDELGLAISRLRTTQDRQARAGYIDPLAPNPEEEGGVRRLADESGLDENDVRLDMQSAQRAAEASRASQALQNAPLLRDWISDPRNSNVARDDVENLSLFERIAGIVRREAPRRAVEAAVVPAFPILAAAGAPLVMADAYRNYRQGELDVEYGNLGFRAHQAQRGRGPALTEQERARLDELASRPGQEDWGLPIVGPTARLAPQILGSVERAGEQAAARIDELHRDVYGSPEQGRDSARRVLNGDTREGINNLIAGSIFTAGAPFAAIGGAGGGYLGFGNEQEVGSAFDQMVRAGADPEIASQRADEYGAWATAIEFAADALGLKLSGTGRLASRLLLRDRVLAAGNPALRAASALGATAVDQGVEEASQQLAQIIHQDLAMQQTQSGSSDVGAAWRSALTPESIQQILTAGFIGAQGGGGMAIIPTSVNFGLDVRAAHAAELNAQIFEQQTRAAQASLVGERHPPTMESAIGAMDQSAVYIDADKFVEHFQAQGVNPYAVADELGIGGDSLGQALNSHAQVQIPLSTYATRVLRIPAHASLAEHTRRSPTDDTPAEAKMAQERFRANVEQLAAEVQAAQTDDDIGQAVEGRIRELMSNVHAPNVAKLEAKLAAALPRALLARARASDPAYAATLEPKLRRLFGEGINVVSGMESQAEGASMAQRGTGADGAPTRSEQWSPPEGVRLAVDDDLNEYRRKIVEMAVNDASNDWIAREMSDGDNIVMPRDIARILDRVKRKLGGNVPWERGEGSRAGVNAQTGEKIVPIEELVKQRALMRAAGYPEGKGQYNSINARLAKRYGVDQGRIASRLREYDRAAQAKAEAQAVETHGRRSQPFDLARPEDRAAWLAEEVLTEAIPGEAADARQYGFTLDTGEIVVMSIAPDPTGAATVDWTFLDRLKAARIDPSNGDKLFSPGAEKIGVRGVLGLMARVGAVLEADMAQFKRDAYVYTPNNEALAYIYKALVNRMLNHVPYATVEDGADSWYLVREGADIASNGTVLPSPENENADPIEWPNVDPAEVEQLQDDYYERLEQRAKGRSDEGDRGAGEQADGVRGSSETGRGVSGTGRTGESDSLNQSAPVWYSAVERVVEASKTARAPGSQWLATISKAPGVKKEELDWIGLPDFLQAQEGPVSREDVLAFVRENGVQVEETVLGKAALAEGLPSQEERLALIEERDRLGAEMYDLEQDYRGQPFSALPDDVQARIEEISTRSEQLDEQIHAFEDVMRGRDRKATRWSQYTLPGGENYRELLLRLPHEGKATGERENGQPHFQGAFQSSHWDQPNVLAHVRFNERVDADGKRTIFIEEVQSDWHQKGRESGYNDLSPDDQKRLTGLRAEIAALDKKMNAITAGAKKRIGGYPTMDDLTREETKAFGDLNRRKGELQAELTPLEASIRSVPNAPFKNNAWAALVMKRMVRYAAENGFEQVAWINGQNAVDRFSLETHATSLDWTKETDGTFTVALHGKDGRGTSLPRQTPEQLSAAVGKDVAEKIVAGKGQKGSSGGRTHGVLRGLDLRVGGEGMKAFYDRILPNIANTIGKKFGAKASATQIAATWGAVDAQGNSFAGGLTREQALGMAEDKPGARAVPHKPQTVHSLPITPEMRDAAMEGLPLFQRTVGDGNRGAIEFGSLDKWKSGEFSDVTIRMTKASDLSTFLHEFGHLAHLTLESLATDQNAPEEFKTMWANTLDWFGVDQAQWDGMNLAQRERYYEQWARTFEAYLMEGKAPSLSLREAFAAFKEWLKEIYRKVFSLDHNFNPQIRDVFDRLLATDAEIAEARAAMGVEFKLDRANFPAMTDEEWTQMQAAASEAREAEEAELRARIFDSHVRKEKRWFRAERNRVRATAIIDVDSEPARRAYEHLAFNEWRELPTEYDDEGNAILSPQREEVVSRKGEGVPTNTFRREDVRLARPKVDGASVQAAMATADEVVETSWGAKLQARAGQDFILTDTEGHRWVVRADLFSATYQQNEDGSFSKSPDINVGYWIAPEATTIQTLEGPVEAKAGDYVMIGAIGENWPLTPARFAQRYEDVIEGKPEDLPEMKLDPQILIAEYGENIFNELPVGLQPSRPEDVDAALESAMELKRQGKVKVKALPLGSWVKKQGGIKDTGGEIRQAIGSGRARPGVINNESGLDPDALALRAQEAGYFGPVLKGQLLQRAWAIETDRGPITIDPSDAEMMRLTRPRLGQDKTKTDSLRYIVSSKGRMFVANAFDMTHDDIARAVRARGIDDLVGYEMHAGDSYSHGIPTGFIHRTGDKLSGVPARQASLSQSKAPDAGSGRGGQPREILEGDVIPPSREVAMPPPPQPRIDRGTAADALRNYEATVQRHGEIGEELNAVSAKMAENLRQAEQLAADIRAAREGRSPNSAPPDGGASQGGQSAEIIQGNFPKVSERERQDFIRLVRNALQSVPYREARIKQAYHQRGLLPLPIGTRMRAPPFERTNTPGPVDGWEVVDYYVHPMKPNEYGYVLRKGDKTVRLAASYERGLNSNRPDVIGGWQALLGPEGATDMRAQFDARLAAEREVRRTENEARKAALPPLTPEQQQEWDLLFPSGDSPTSAQAAASSSQEGQEDGFKFFQSAVNDGGMGNAAGGNRSSQRVTETPEFKRWFGESQVVDRDGKPLVVFHGTTGVFDEFDKARSNIESDLGSAFYFTNDVSDVGSNYAGIGPDLTNKIEREAERIAGETERNYDDPDVVAEARAKFVEHEGVTMPVYLSLQNPVVLGGDNETVFTFEESFDEDTEEYGEPTGTLVDFIGALRDAAYQFDAESESAIDQIFGEATDGMGITASRLMEIIKADEKFQYAEDPQTGDMASNEVLRLAFEQAGFDGIIDHTVNKKFGSERRTGKQMEGMSEETVHYVAFKPEQIKSAIGNRGTFDPASSNILFQDAPDPTRRVSVREFIDALVADLKGERPVYSSLDEEALEAYQNRTDQQRWFEKRGVDLSGSKAQIRAQIVDALNKEAENPNGVDPDTAASWFGFSSGDEMIQAMKGMKPREQAIEDRIDQIVEAHHGDPIKDGTVAEEARAAAHNEAQAHSIELDLAAIERAAGGRTRPVGKAARAYAEAQIQKMTVKQIRGYDSFLAAERRSARNTLDATKKGDFATARIQKQRQLVSFWLYKLARDAAEEMDKTQVYFAKFQRPGTRQGFLPEGGRHLEQIDQVLEAVDLRKSPPISQRRRDSFNEYLAKLQDEGIDTDDIVELDPAFLEAIRRRPFNSLTLEEVRGLRDVVRNFETLGRRWNQVLTDRKHRQLNDVITGMVARAEAEYPKRAAIVPSLASRSKFERAVDMVMDLHGSMVKVEQMMRFMDGLKANGPWFSTFIPAAQRAESAKSDRMEAETERFAQLISVYSKKELGRMMLKKIHIAAIGDSLTKMQMIGVALNTGNAYNMEGLMKGFQWNEDQVRAVLDQLDARDAQFVQGVWDFLGSFKEESFALDQRVRGIRPEEVAPTPVNIANMQLSGGYFPVKFDPDHPNNVRAAKQQAKEAVEQLSGGSYRQVGTKRGRLKQRVGTAGMAFRLDPISIISEHVEETVHDLTHREFVIDARRLIASRRVRDAIRSVVGRFGVKALDAWIAKIEQPSPRVASTWERLAGKIRNNATIVNMGWKITTALIQELGTLNVIPRTGILPLLKQKGITIARDYPVFLARQTARLFGAPETMPARIQFIFDRSPFMKQRMENRDRDVREAIATRIGERPGILPQVPKKVQDSMLALSGLMDMAVSVPAWLAGYESALGGKVKGIAQGDEQAAIEHADSIVRTTQSGGAPKDLAAILASDNQFWRLATMFQSWGSTYYNQLFVEQIPGVMAGKIPVSRFTANMLFIWFVPALVTMWFYGRMEPQDGEDEDDFRKRMAAETALYPLQGIPIVRDGVNSYLTHYDYQFSPAQAAMEAPLKLIQAAERGNDEAVAKQALLSAGYLFGLPARQMWITGEGLTDIATGEEDFMDDPLDSTRELLVRDSR